MRMKPCRGGFLNARRVNRFNEISAKFAEPMSDDEMEKLLAEQAKVQDQMDSQNLWDLDR